MVGTQLQDLVTTTYDQMMNPDYATVLINTNGSENYSIEVHALTYFVLYPTKTIHQKQIYQA